MNCDVVIRFGIRTESTVENRADGAALLSRLKSEIEQFGATVDFEIIPRRPMGRPADYIDRWGDPHFIREEKTI